MMDIISCGLLTLSEVFLLQPLLLGRSDASSLRGSGDHYVAFFLVQYLTLKFYRIFLYHRYFSPLRHVPGPKNNHFLFGQALHLLRAPSPTVHPLAWMRQHPSAPFLRYRTWFNTEVLVCNSPETCRAVLQTHCYAIRKSDWYMRSGREVLGKGLIAQDDEAQHRAHRRVLSAPFSFANIRQLEPLFKEKARGLRAVLQKAVDVGDDAGEEGKLKQTGVIDCTEVFSKAFLDIIGVTTLGKELSQLDTVGFGKGASAGEPASFHHAYNEFFAPPEKRKQLLTFASGFCRAVRWLPLRANREFQSAMGALHGSLRALIRERLAERRERLRERASAGEKSTSWEETGSSTATNTQDLLTFMVDEILQGEPGAAEALTEEVLLGDLLEFMGAGHETSATTVSWALMVLAQDHAVQDKLRAEIGALLHKVRLESKHDDVDLPFNEVDKLPYLDHFLKEVLRVYPPANALYRQTSTALTIQGLAIPKNTHVDMFCALPQQNPLVWGPDAGVVNPDRWDGLAQVNNKTAADAGGQDAGGGGGVDPRLHPFAFEAFSNGPRICLGRGFALLELKTILVELVRHFRFVRVESTFTLPNPSLTLRPNGLEVRLETARL